MPANQDCGSCGSMKSSWLLAMGLCLVVLWGCGGSNSSTSPGPTNVSVLYADAVGGVVAFTINTDGSLSALPSPNGANIGPAMGVSQSFIFGGDSAPFGTSVASLQTSFPSGKLQLVSEAGFPIIGGTTINHMTVCGSQIFAGDINGALVAYALGPQGQLTQAGQIVGFSGAPWGMAAN